MRRIFKKSWFKTLFISLVLLFICLNILAFFHSKAMCHFSQSGAKTPKPEELTFIEKVKILFFGVNIPRPLGTATPASWGMEFENHQFGDPKGNYLGAWFIPNTNSPVLIILFHGYAQDKSNMLVEAKLLHESGYSLFMVDFRGSGNSSGSTTSIGYWEAADVNSAMRYVSQNFKPKKIILLGYSMGAVAILRAIDVYGTKPEGIVIEAVFDKSLTTARNRFREMGVPSFPSAQLMLFWGGVQMGFNAFKHNPVTYAKRVNCAALFLHGGNDTRAFPHEAHGVFRAVPHQNKVFKIFPGISHKHIASRLPKKWIQAVSNFVKNHCQLSP
jgi:dipeptidyl aminopeptidase/acylaminoacyl peptidase